MRQPAVQQERDTVSGAVSVQDSGTVLTRDSHAPGLARHYVAGVLIGLRVPPCVVEAARIITSELVTNSVKYGCAQWVWVRVRMRAGGGGVTLTVSDSTPYRPLPTAGQADDEDENGRGLFLVDALAARWGHGCAGADPSYGTAVWAELTWEAGA